MSNKIICLWIIEQKKNPKEWYMKKVELCLARPLPFSYVFSLPSIVAFVQTLPLPD